MLCSSLSTGGPPGNALELPRAGRKQRLISRTLMLSYLLLAGMNGEVALLALVVASAGSVLVSAHGINSEAVVSFLVYALFAAMVAFIVGAFFGMPFAILDGLFIELAALIGSAPEP